jgi:hypothetical protein
VIEYFCVITWVVSLCQGSESGEYFDGSGWFMEVV